MKGLARPSSGINRLLWIQSVLGYQKRPKRLSIFLGGNSRVVSALSQECSRATD